MNPGRLVSSAAILCVAILAFSASGQDTAYTVLDRHALTAPAQDERTLDTLAAYLVQPAHSERDKARVIYRWMTDRIAYDVDSFLQGHPGELRPEGVLLRRRAVCSGYTALFTALAQRVGLETATLNGYAKGVSHRPGLQVHASNHAWNAVKLQGQWHLLDVTWGAGHVNGNRFVKRYQESFFLTPPTQLVLTHMPADYRWQLLNPPLTRAQFESLPSVDPPLFELGVPHDTLWKTMHAAGFRKFVKVYDHDGPVTIHAAPLAGNLTPGREYYFRIESPHAVNMAIINNGQFTFLQRNGRYFEGAIRPQPGDLKLGQQRHPHDRNFQSILGYHTDR